MGLIKTGLKAVVAVKTADVIHERILERQAAHSGGQGPPQPLPSGAPPAAPPPPAPAAPGDDILDRLTRLGELRANGVLTEPEFEAQKARILNG